MAGSEIMDPRFAPLVLPAAAANIAIGGRHLSRFFIRAGQTLYAVNTKIRGARLP